MIKKGIILSLFVVVLMFPVYIFAYTGGTYNYYVDMQTTELGAITVYIPWNYADCFTINGNQIINQTQSNITGYVAGVNATIRFTPFNSVPQYQSNYQWIDLTINNISDYNIPVLKSIDFLKISIERLAPYIYIVILMVVICLLFIRT